MHDFIWVPETTRPDGRLGRLKLVPGKRLFIAKTLKAEGLRGWQAPTTAALLAAWDLAPDHVFFDVGANIGIYALLHNRLRPEGVSVAFEPTPMLVEKGLAMTRVNDLKVRWEQLAVSDADGEATLYLSSRSDASNSLVRGFRTAVDTITVPTTTLDSYVQRTRLLPAVIKIDVESHEPAVIRGTTMLLRTRRPVIIAELLHGRTAAAAAVHKLLGEHGYVGRHLRTVADEGNDPTLRDWLFWPGQIPASFDRRFLDWSSVIARCVPINP